MNKLILSILFFLILYRAPVYAQNSNTFEGIIKVVKTNKTDTVTLVFMIKDNKMRINKLNKHQQIEKYAIVNLSIPEIYYLKPDKKIYTKIPSYNLKKSLDTNLVLLKTGNYKTILGEKCYQWRLKIPDINTEITYWVTSKKYPQFYTILDMFDNDITGKYLLSIKGNENVFPMLVVKRSLLREWKSQIKVTEIKKIDINNQEFEIPKDYTLFEK
jgi:hypothetical protein